MGHISGWAWVGQGPPTLHLATQETFSFNVLQHGFMNFLLLIAWPKAGNSGFSAIPTLSARGSARRSCCPTIVSRSQWGARSPKSRTPLKTPVPLVIIHHTEGNLCSSLASCSKEVKGIQNYHLDKRGWADIGYNFLIGEDGRVYEGRGWRTMGSHARKVNRISLGFSFLGNRAPNAAALNAAKKLIQCAISRGYLSRSYTLKGHRNVMPTSCPGNALYAIIRMWPRFKA
uniref:Peptidoglycan-recognition protein n=1 Tax=Pelusios castaneus TaxID=367368 RepID=A0A8C8VQ34_9SAUR